MSVHVQNNDITDLLHFHACRSNTFRGMILHAECWKFRLQCENDLKIAFTCSLGALVCWNMTGLECNKVKFMTDIGAPLSVFLPFPCNAPSLSLSSVPEFRASRHGQTYLIICVPSEYFNQPVDSS